MRRKGHSLGGAVSPCSACKLHRRKCEEDCIFAPYFPAKEPNKFAIVHKIFGASNVNKMLQVLSENHRRDAVSSMVYEANARVQDPVYGCVGTILSLHRQLETLETQLAFAQAELVHMKTLHRIDTKSPLYMTSGITFPANKDFSNDVDMAFVYANGASESIWSCSLLTDLSLQ